MVYRKKTMKTKSKSKRKMYRRPLIVKTERKKLDFNGTVTITQAGVLTLLTGVTTQGTNDSQRIGDSIYGRSLFVRFTLIANVSSNYDNVRVIFVQDKQGYNAPAVSDILETGTLSSGFAPFSQYNHFYMSRFKILYDKCHTLRLVSYQCYNFSVSCRVFSKLEFVGASTFKNQVYMLLVGDNGNVLQLPICNFVSRLIYTDS